MAMLRCKICSFAFLLFLVISALQGCSNNADTAEQEKDRKQQIDTGRIVHIAKPELPTSLRPEIVAPALAYPYSQYNVDFVMSTDGGQRVTLPVIIDTGSSAFGVLGYDFCSMHYNGSCKTQHRGWWDKHIAGYSISESKASVHYVTGGWEADICYGSSFVSVGEYGFEPIFGSIYS